MHPLQTALAAVQRGELDLAQGLLDQLLLQSPMDYQAKQLSGIVQRRRGNLAAAAVLFQQSLAIHEGQPHVHNNLGITLAALFDVVQAEKSYRRAIALDAEFVDPLFNLGLLLIEAKRFAEAREHLEHAARLQPQNARVFEALSIVLRETDDRPGSIASARQAVSLAVKSFSAHYQLGQAHMGMGEFAAAASAYQNAVALNPKSDVAWIGLGHALRGKGQSAESKSAYQHAVDLNPGNADAHRLYNEMVWQTGDVPRYLQSFGVALKSRPNDHLLRLTYANELLNISQHEQASVELEHALRDAPRNAGALEAMARAKSLASDYESAEHFHALALAEAPENPLFFRSFAETLLKSRKHQKAHEITSQGLKRFPYEQGILALHTTSQRLIGDDNFARWADYLSIAKVMKIEPPPGYADVETFCSDLSVLLEGLHTTKAHPTDQTLRGGTQTFGALFQNQAPILQQFVVQLRKSITQFISEMPDDRTHPLFKRASRDFAFAGSWSVRLSTGGFHTNHFHPDGWISSAFYVNVPDAVSTLGNNDGWLKFGETSLELGDREVIHRVVQPKVGHLALFPSYFWHGTVPFESASPRITIAFDVIPK